MKKFTEITQALQWINEVSSISTYSIPVNEKLIRIIQALKYFKNPQQNFKIIHITGTKGKSSTAKACAYFLKEQKYSVGLFTSPHIHSYNERIQINLQSITDKDFLNLLNKIYNYTYFENTSLTMFEILTLAACLHFKNNAIDYAVFEVGIGGRYDTTNFIQPVLSIISHIEKEHTEILGNELEEIAYDKAGIIKKNIPVWVGLQTNLKTLEVIKEYAKTQEADIFNISYYFDITHTQVFKNNNIVTISTLHTLDNKDFSSWNNIIIRSNCLSFKIIEDHILALVSIYTLLNINPQKEYQLNNEIMLPCRAEIINIPQLPIILLDGAHTKYSLQTIITNIKIISTHIIVVFALSKGKDLNSIAKLFHDYRSLLVHIIITQAGTMRFNFPDRVYNEFSNYFNSDNISLIPDEKKALEYALQIAQKKLNIKNNIKPNIEKENLSLPIVAVLGSFYLCADCRSWLLNENNFINI